MLTISWKDGSSGITGTMKLKRKLGMEMKGGVAIMWKAVNDVKTQQQQLEEYSSNT